MNWWVYLIAFIIIGVQIYIDRKGIKNFKFKIILEGIKEAKFKDYLKGFLWFVLVLLLARGFAIGQTEAQTCQIGVDPIPYGYYENSHVGEVYLYVTTDFLNVLEQNRSYNYYRRYFNWRGGRPANVWIKCEWKMESFIKNIKLDYLDRNAYQIKELNNDK